MNIQREPTILIVDDIEANRMILEEILHDKYTVSHAANGREALDIVVVEKPALILLDVVMPELDGFETIKRVKQNPKTRHIPVIFITGDQDDEAKGLSHGAVDYIFKPFESEIVKMRVETHVELARHRSALEDMVKDKADELVYTKEIFLETMAEMIEYRSAESGQHVKRTKELSAVLLQYLLKKGPYVGQLQQVDHTAMVKAVPLHDIGKIAIPDNILLKPGRLTNDEFETIKTHTTAGSQIIDTLISSGIDDEYIRHCYDICLYHHEHWDGAGYPLGLSGTDIPLSSRIVALVDVYDALVCARCYKKAFTHDEGVRIIAEASGSHFDPAVVDAFLSIESVFLTTAIKQNRPLTYTV